MLVPAVDGVSQQIGHIQACDGMNKQENRSAYIAFHFPYSMLLLLLLFSMFHEIASLHCCIAYSKASVV